MNFVATITRRISVVNFTLEYTRNQLESWLKHEVEFIYLTRYTLTSVQYLASPYSSLPFPLVLTRRTCLTITNFLGWKSFSLFS